MADGSEVSGSGKNLTTKEYKIFNDSVHGHIKMHPLLVEIIDTPEFQRLRNIKQLGGGYYVFPGASHNRFEHSIGVAHLAGELVRSLTGSLRGTEVKTPEDLKDELCVEIAGLCHDLGHGPFSHVFEEFIKKANPDLKWKHEKESVKIFERLINKNIKKNNKTIKKIMEDDYGLNDNDIKFITELINTETAPHSENATEKTKKWSYIGRGKEKSYLYEIVANKLTGIDVDKMDYFSRDCHHLGMKSNFSHERYVMFAKVLTNEDDEKQICMRDKEAINMYELFHVRYLLHHNAYQHTVKVAVEMMIVDALLAAEGDFTLNDKKISEAANDLEMFLKLSDDILNEIKHKSKKAKCYIEKIENRDLYCCVDSNIFKSENLKVETEAAQQKEVESWCNMLQKDTDLKGKFKVRVIKIDYGKETKNPIDSLRFYSKDKKKEVKQLTVDKVSYIQPETFYETKVMLFYIGEKPVPVISKEEMEKFWDSIRKPTDKQQQNDPQNGDLKQPSTSHK